MQNMKIPTPVYLPGSTSLPMIDSEVSCIKIPLEPQLWEGLLCFVSFVYAPVYFGFKTFVTFII